MGASDYDRWLQQPYAEKDRRDAEFEARVDERVEVMMDGIAKGQDDGDIERLYEDPCEFLRRVMVAALAANTPHDEIAMNVRDIIRDECIRIATERLERGQ